MNSITQNTVGLPWPVGSPLPPRLEQLGELLQKREALRLIYRELKPDGDDHNLCLMLRDVERAAAILERRISIVRQSLQWGVA